MKKLLLFAAAYAALSSLTLFAMEDSIYVEQPETKTEAATSKKTICGANGHGIQENSNEEYYGQRPPTRRPGNLRSVERNMQRNKIKDINSGQAHHGGIVRPYTGRKLTSIDETTSDEVSENTDTEFEAATE